ncbi:MAG: hypothetical protein A3F70_12590 [Acidobacteria bacterium RIFCSPLOWO2_12_FULL_67_14]|nr:MAG: hypothetical protein A3H29_00730 [Acidobacteria bacterium RIFCSPLOWO2_02_FULL_67_21]OFW37210.1 MAG: hypothetical protein A3F70_12590 [Acidobacteria bacterium RIFCSPLOWO2_12_FULL_67_14]
MKAVIAVGDLGKRYRVGQRRRHVTLRDAMVAAASAPLERLRGARRQAPWIWALRHASFEVMQGEVLGLIGRNGAGKSTLLKILSRVVEPTEGRADIRGRIASLLEVGTGFHPELTGRENIYLNGAILGMRKAEIDRTFDEILAFAETERFVDTPVKHYSSGMYTRLAFAVAAHLEPDILIVDEVLAVGDGAFQRKCLGRMHHVARDGRTVLFVSHNMDAVRRLCSRVMLLRDGQLVADGEPGTVIARYLAQESTQSPPDEWIPLAATSRRGTGEARFVAARYSSLETGFAGYAHSDGPLTFFVTIESDIARTVDSMAVKLSSPSGVTLINAEMMALGQTLGLKPGTNRARIAIRQVHLTPGTYDVGLWLGDSHGRTFDHLDPAFSIDVVDDPLPRFGVTPKGNGFVPCCFQVFQDDGVA